MANNEKLTKEQILALLVAKKIDSKTALKQLDELDAKPITFKVSERTGAVCVYGLNIRTPVTLYADQWTRFLDFVGAPENSNLRQFIQNNWGLCSHGRADSTKRKTAFDAAKAEAEAKEIESDPIAEEKARQSMLLAIGQPANSNIGKVQSTEFANISQSNSGLQSAR
jgi:hypothetical protein